MSPYSARFEMLSMSMSRPFSSTSSSISSRMTSRSMSISFRSGPGEHGAERLDADLQVVRVQGRVVVAVVARGDAVQVPADVLDPHVELRPSGKRSHPRKKRCSRKWETPLVSARLVAGAGADVDGEHGRVQVRRFDRDDPEPVRQAVFLVAKHVAPFGPQWGAGEYSARPAGATSGLGRIWTISAIGKFADSVTCNQGGSDGGVNGMIKQAEGHARQGAPPSGETSPPGTAPDTALGAQRALQGIRRRSAPAVVDRAVVVFLGLAGT